MAELKLENYDKLPDNEQVRMVRLPAAIPYFAVMRKANLHAYQPEKDFVIFEIRQINDRGEETSLTWGIKPDELRSAMNLLESWQKEA